MGGGFKPPVLTGGPPPVKFDAVDCVVEFDQVGLAVEIDDTYLFMWVSVPGEFAQSHTATLTLPRGHELLSVAPKPVNVSTSGGVVVATFEQHLSAGEPFVLTGVFSKKGLQLLQSAEDNFSAKRYSEAKKDYQEAIDFYSPFDTINGKDKGPLLTRLLTKITECEAEEAKESKKAADDKFAEGMTAFNSEDYDTAAQLFTEAQRLYTSAGDAAKIAECSDYLSQCATLLQQLMDKADTLFNEGSSLFDQKKFSEAKAKFEEARTVYEKLKNSEKVKMCEEKIAICEEKIKEGGICVGSSLISAIVASAALGTCRVRKKR